MASAKKVLIMDTILRDAHQSQAATRMRLDEMLPVAELLDSAGYYALEVWGGATFDSCLRYLNEDPWERLRALRKAMPKTKLQMLLRGQNILGYKHYSDDVVDKFCELSIKNGIDIIRIFDALNDVRNVKKAMESTKKYGGKVEAAISYTTSEVHTRKYFVDLAAQLESMGADIICIKDMANLLLPYEAYELVKMLKDKIKVPIHLHTHNTAGTGDMTVLKAIEAGCDIVDTALSPLGNGSSQPATEPLVATLNAAGYKTGLDIAKLSKISEHFKAVAKRLKKDGFISDEILSVDINALIYQVPGGMLSNLISQLKAQNALDKYNEVLSEVPKVRADFGYPPLVTPSSQIVGTQAVMNVVCGERYKMVTKESKDMLKGEYGKLPMEPNPEILKKIVGDEKIKTNRPADDIPPEMPKYTKECAEYSDKEEDILTYALFPQLAANFFKAKKEGRNIAEQPKPAAAAAPIAQVPAIVDQTLNVTVNGKTYVVLVAAGETEKSANGLEQKASAPAPEVKAPVIQGLAHNLKTPLPGMILKLRVKSGEAVKKGQVVLVLEAMKMENDIKADRDGVLTFKVSEGATVSTGDVLAAIET